MPDPSASATGRPLPKQIGQAQPGGLGLTRGLRILLHRLLPKSPLGDALFSALPFWHTHRRLPHWRRPETFNDHLFAMKRRGELYDPLRQFISDKYLVKHYITAQVGADYTLTTLDYLRSDAEIEAFTAARRPCIVKPSHLTGRVMLVAEGDAEPDKAQLKSWLRLNLYARTREANYRYLRPGILVEEVFVDAEGGIPQDIKLFCIGGRVRFIMSIRDRFGSLARNLYTPAWEKLPFGMVSPPSEDHPRPACLPEMIGVAETLAEPFGFIRVDFLVADGRPRIGELTNITGNGLDVFLPRDYDRRLAALFRDPEVTIEALLAR